MAQDPAGPRADCDWRPVGDFCAGGTARPHHCGRGARAHLQAGGGAALPRPRCGGDARADGKRRGRARFGHAFAGKLLQLPEGQVHAAGIARARGRPKDAARPRGGHAADGARRQGDADFFTAAQGGHHPAAGAQGADDFVSQPARLFNLAAMSQVRLRGRVPELQRVADVSSHRAEAGLPHLRPQRARTGGLPE